MKAGILGLVGIVALLIAPSAIAVHGEAYDAYGTATLGSQVFLVHVAWSGYSWSAPSFFTVTIKDLAGNLVKTEQFPGAWQGNGPVFLGQELLVYHGWAVDGSPHFDITGFQEQQVAGGGPQKAIMVYTGNYFSYALTLVVPYEVFVPF